ncbi:MAG TPA: hypothetical protein VI488_10040, partial [Candidatus Angelobacter sp.]
MKLMRNISLLPWSMLACVMAVALLSGCSQKKQGLAASPPAPPAATPEPQPTPAEPQAQTQESQPATQGTPPPESQPAQAAPEKTEPGKTKNAKTHPTTKKTGTETARNTPPKTVVKPDGAETAPAAGEISPALSHDESVHSQATTEQLLQNTEASLNGIKRQLSPDEQAVVTQIRDFMNQSRQATKANDLTRAY